jgi:hypothetical protein
MTRSDILAEAISRLRPLPHEQLPYAKAVTDRLRDDWRAGDAIAKMTTDTVLAEKIVFCCIQADTVARDFKEMAKTEQEIPARMSDLRKALREIDQFVVELDVGPRNSVSAYVALEYGESEYLRVALGRIAGLINARERVALQTIPRLGVTRKWSAGAETAAIGWLAAGIAMITNHPHDAHVAVLAEVTLGADEVISIDRVRAARKTQHSIDWATVGMP